MSNQPASSVFVPEARQPSQLDGPVPVAPTLVCFDMDGLLVNTEPMWWHAEAALMSEYGGSWTDDDGRACVGGPLEKVADLIIGRTGQGSQQEIIDNLIARMEVLLRTSEISWMPGAHELLVDCSTAGHRVALVSASPRVLVDAVLSSIGSASDHFEFSISCDDVPVSKPDPAPYLLAAARFGSAATRLIVLEDSPTGIESALAAGAGVIAVPHLVAVSERRGLKVVTSLTEVTSGTVEEFAAERSAEYSSQEVK